MNLLGFHLHRGPCEGIVEAAFRHFTVTIGAVDGPFEEAIRALQRALWRLGDPGEDGESTTRFDQANPGE